MRLPALTKGVVGVILGVVVAAGCTPEVPVPNPDRVVLTPEPVLTVKQYQNVLTSVGMVIAEGNATKDPAVLTPRVIGPALTMRSTQLKIAAALGQDDVIIPIPVDAQDSVITTNATWPRTSFAATVQPPDGSSNRLLVLDQVSARDNYQLWAWARLFPGTTMPDFAEPTQGSEAVPLDDPSLVMTPTDAVAQYADVLTLGSNSMFAQTFPSDPFQALLASEADRWINAGGLAAAGGTYAMNFTVDPGQTIHALRTQDGGAVVVGALIGTQAITAPDKAQIPAGTKSQQVLLADAPVTNKLTVTYTDIVAIYVPPTGSTDPVRVLGTEQQVVAAAR